MHAARIEGAEIIRCSASVKKDAAYQKPGEDEKEIDATPANSECAENVVRPETELDMIGSGDVMANDDEKYGETPQSVEL